MVDFQQTLSPTTSLLADNRQWSLKVIAPVGGFKINFVAAY